MQIVNKPELYASTKYYAFTIEKDGKQYEWTLISYRDSNFGDRVWSRQWDEEVPTLTPEEIEELENLDLWSYDKAWEQLASAL